MYFDHIHLQLPMDTLFKLCQQALLTLHASPDFNPLRPVSASCWLILLG